MERDRNSSRLTRMALETFVADGFAAESMAPDHVKEEQRPALRRTCEGAVVWPPSDSQALRKVIPAGRRLPGLGRQSD
jgi:hypothetical protein